MALGNRVETLETGQDNFIHMVAALQGNDKHLKDVLNPLWINSMITRTDRRQLFVYKISQKRLVLLTYRILFRAYYNNFLVQKPPTSIEIDRVHRALLPVPQNVDKPNDIICKLHKYSVKEAIMRPSRSQQHIDFDGAKISLFPDLFRRTLLQQRALRPVLDALHSASATSNATWGFPFHLTAMRNGRSAVLHTKNDLP